jgi:hypothetical protein
VRRGGAGQGAPVEGLWLPAELERRAVAGGVLVMVNSSIEDPGGPAENWAEDWCGGDEDQWRRTAR